MKKTKLGHIIYIASLIAFLLFYGCENESQAEYDKQEVQAEKPSELNQAVNATSEESTETNDKDTTPDTEPTTDADPIGDSEVDEVNNTGGTDVVDSQEQATEPDQTAESLAEEKTNNSNDDASATQEQISEEDKPFTCELTRVKDTQTVAGILEWDVSINDNQKNIFIDYSILYNNLPIKAGKLCKNSTIDYIPIVAAFLSPI